MTAGTADLVGLSALVARGLLGAIFLQAGLQKLRHYAEWQGVVGNYRVMPFTLVPAFSYALPVAEIGLAVALWFGRGAAAAGGAAGSAAVLLVLFCVAIGINLARGRSHIDCGCFQSSLRQALSGSLLVRNGVLVLIALAAAGGGATRSLPATALAACLGGVCFVLYLALNELLVQSRPALTLPSLRRL